MVSRSQISGTKDSGSEGLLEIVGPEVTTKSDTGPMKHYIRKVRVPDFSSSIDAETAGAK